MKSIIGLVAGVVLWVASFGFYVAATWARYNGNDADELSYLRIVVTCMIWGTALSIVSDTTDARKHKGD